MVPADPREVNSQEGAFMMSTPPDPFKPSEFGHLPLHWYTHAMHALEVIAYRHPIAQVQNTAFDLYLRMVETLHLNHEHYHEMVRRLSEDRISKGNVVS